MKKQEIKKLSKDQIIKNIDKFKKDLQWLAIELAKKIIYD